MFSLRSLTPRCLGRRASLRTPTHQFATVRLTSTNANQYEDALSPVYVHQVSKSVLCYLQNYKHGWLSATGLDRGLRLNANGTFVLQFPSRKGFDSGRIWTSYDISTRKHYINVYRKSIKSRFLLKDATYHQKADVVQQQIHNTIDEVVETVC